MKVFQNTGTHPRALLVDQLQSREEKWYRASTMFILTSRMGSLQKKHWYSRVSSGKFGDLITADHKVLSEGCESRNNHRYAVVVQDLATQWIQSYPCNTKTSQERQKS